MLKDASFNYENQKISFENCCIYGNKRWFVANEFNALCSMDIEGGKIEYIGVIPCEDVKSKYLFADIKYYDNKLYLIPRGASSLVIYDIMSHEYKCIKINLPSKRRKNKYKGYLKFSIGVIQNGKMLMIPRTYPAIVIFDLINETLSYEDSWIDDLEEYIFEDEAYFWADYAVQGDDLLLAGANNDCILRRSFTNGKYNIQQIYNGNKGYSGIEYFDGRLFLASRKDGQILQIEKEKIKRLILPNDFKVSKVIGFSRLIKNNSYIYAIPMWANFFIRINLDTLNIEKVQNYDKERYENEEIATCCGWVEQNQICIYNNLKNGIEIYSENCSQLFIKMRLDKDFRREYVENFCSSKNILCENKMLKLDDFLNFV